MAEIAGKAHLLGIFIVASANKFEGSSSRKAKNHYPVSWPGRVRACSSQNASFLLHKPVFGYALTDA